MVTISYVVARSTNGVIGCESRLPWHLPSDLRRFKTITLDHPIIMGRATFESIGRALPRRENIVLSRDESFRPEGVQVFPDKGQAVSHAERWLTKHGGREIMVIGGAETYRQFAEDVSRVYLTKVHTTIACGDAFFRDEFRSNEWTSRQTKPVHPPEDEFATTFCIFERVGTGVRSTVTADAVAAE